MATTPASASDFDFSMGIWKCRHRYRVRRLADCHDWIEFDGNCAARKILGGFAKGVGTFYGDDSFKGRPIRVRYLWSRITDQSARWEQAFSLDEGNSWETNWTMDFTRV